MMDNINKIGIAIWGVKGGFRVFCSQGIDTRNDEVMNTMKDIRNFIRINNATIDFYALEFTHHYKVYTLYRSVDESNGRSGAFIAITVFVPHPLRFMELRSSLVEMMDAYFKEYIDPVSNMPLAGKYDDIMPFVTILSKHQAQIEGERGHFLSEPSEQNNLPKVFPYASLEVVDKFFDSPYRPEFYKCQEVMFLDEKLVNNPTLHNVIFGITFYRFDPDRIGEQVRTGILNKFNYPSGSIMLFKKNGEDILDTYSEYGFSEEDQLELKLSKSYHQDIVFQGTFREAIEKGIFRKQDENYKFAIPRFEECQYILPVVVEGIDAERIKDIVLKLFIDKMPATGIESRYDEQKDSLYFVIKGERVTKVHTISYIWGDSFFTCGKQVKPEEIVNSDEGGIVICLKKHVFRLAEKLESTYEGKCCVLDASVPFRFTKNNRTFSVWLPDDEQRFADDSFVFKAEGYIGSITDGVVSFEANFVELFVQLSDEIPSKISKELVFNYSIGGKKYDCLSSSTGTLYFKLPKDVVVKKENDLWLLINNNLCKCKYNLMSHYSAISPELKLCNIDIQDFDGGISCQIRTSDKKEFEYKVNSKVEDILIPQGADIVGIKYSGSQQFEIAKDGLPSKGSLQKQSIQIRKKNGIYKAQDKELPKIKAEDITYTLCSKVDSGLLIRERIYTQEKDRFICLKKGKKISVTGKNLSEEGVLSIYKNEETIVCRINPPGSDEEKIKQTNEENKQNGYNVKWNASKSECTVAGIESKRTSKPVLCHTSNSMKKILYLSAFFAFIFVLITWVSIGYVRSKQPVATLKIILTDSSIVEKIVSVNINNMQSEVEKGDFWEIYLFDENSKTDESKVSIKGDVEIQFDGEGVGTYPVKFKKAKQGKSFELPVISPGRKALKDTTYQSIQEYGDAANRYKKLEADFAEKAWRLVLDNSLNDSLLSNYESNFSDYHGADIEGLKNKNIENQQAKEKKEDIVLKYQNLWNTLYSMNCSMDTVKQIEKEFNEIINNKEYEGILKEIKDSTLKKSTLTPYLVKLKLSLYEKYFTNSKEGGLIDSMTVLKKYQSRFSKAQYAVIEYYIKGGDAFKALRKHNFKTFQEVESFVEKNGGKKLNSVL